MNDSQRVASIGDDGLVRVWSVSNGGATLSGSFSTPLNAITHRRHALSAIALIDIGGTEVIVRLYCRL
jgi:WD40 repeat protein